MPAKSVTIANSIYVSLCFLGYLLTCSPDLWRVLLKLWLLSIQLISLVYRYLLTVHALPSSEGSFWNFDYCQINLSLCFTGFLLTCSPDLWRVLLPLWLLPNKLIFLLFRISPYLLSFSVKCPAKSLTIANSIYVSLCYSGYLLHALLISEDPSDILTIANSTYLFAIQDPPLLALLISEGSFWCGVAQLVARRLAVRQARVRFSARHHREGLPTELSSDEEMEIGPSEWRWINVLYECDWMNECMYVIKKIWKINKKSGIMPPNLFYPSDTLTIAK